MRKFSADIIFPVSSAPAYNGVVITDDVGKILQLGKREDFDSAELEILQGAIIPGLINTHCHLELSHMKGMIPTGTKLIPFITGILQKRNSKTAEEIQEAIVQHEKEMIANGIVAVGDISNTTDTFAQKAKGNLHYHTFIELFDLVPSLTDSSIQSAKDLFKKVSFSSGNKASLAPHAPYSVSQRLFRFIDEFNADKNLPTSMHNQETEDENLFFLNGTGNFPAFFTNAGFDLSFFKPTGKKSLQSTLPFMPKAKKVLLVHNTMCDEGDISFAHQSSHEIYWCTNPNANLYIESRLPDYNLWRKMNCKITIGTDSIASNWQLSILDEMKTIRKYHSSIPFDEILKWATLNGAEILGFDQTLGSIEIGKTPGLNLLSDIEHPTSNIQKATIKPLI